MNLKWDEYNEPGDRGDDLSIDKIRLADAARTSVTADHLVCVVDKKKDPIL